MTSCLALTFHGLEEPDSKGCLPLSGDNSPYTLSSHYFREALEMVSSQSSCTAGGLLEKKNGDWIVITFDDGLISDYEVAFPFLEERGLAATFFVTANNVGTTGYVSQMQLREMAEAGMEIGSHGLSHSYLVTMEAGQVHKEITESRRRLEDIVGRPVISFAPVGGHFNGRMVEIARQAGYRCFASMLPGVSNLKKEYCILRRNHLQSQHDTRYLQRLLAREKGLLVKNFLRYRLLFMAKRILGMQRYDQLRNLLVEGGG